MKTITYLETADEVIDAFHPTREITDKSLFIGGDAWIDSSHGGDLQIIDGPENIVIKGVEMDQLIRAMAERLHIPLDDKIRK